MRGVIQSGSVCLARGDIFRSPKRARLLVSAYWPTSAAAWGHDGWTGFLVEPPTRSVRFVGRISPPSSLSDPSDETKTGRSNWHRARALASNLLLVYARALFRVKGEGQDSTKNSSRSVSFGHSARHNRVPRHQPLSPAKAG
jgi:hypothetical protein